MAKFLHEKIDGRDNGWWKIDGDRLVNRVGGWHPYKPEEDEEIIECEGWNELEGKIDYSYLLKPNSRNGWLDRGGNYYGCNYSDHDILAQKVLKKSEIELENLGWVKIGGYTEEKEVYWDVRRHRLTEQQIKYLVDNYWDCKQIRMICKLYGEEFI